MRRRRAKPRRRRFATSRRLTSLPNRWGAGLQRTLAAAGIVSALAGGAFVRASAEAPRVRRDSGADTREHRRTNRECSPFSLLLFFRRDSRMAYKERTAFGYSTKR